MDKTHQINLLSNEPCREDAFEGHSHRNIASQIARLIKEDEKRHIIGIEGGWGSGKSNLISLVNKSLNGEDVYNQEYDHKNSKYPFFVYDAWGHQADYQRRAILEELTQELTVEKKILNQKKWEKKLEELLAKRKRTTTKEVPRLGFGLLMSIILCALTPLIVFSVNQIPEEKWWWRLLMSMAPYILGFAWVYCDRMKSIKENGQKPSFATVLAESVLVYKNKIKENETYTTISEKEPSSAEFKAWMDEVDQDLTDQKKILVIVFDNMDRLPSQKVEGLWSSIHSFFSDKTYESIRVLIPFDRQHVQIVFKDEGAGKESYGNDFINKTFDVVFRVPPPIMTGWQSYMANLWRIAFGDSSEIDSSVTQIYDALNKNHTPRKIIAFINEIATVKMTMGDVVPDKYIALFVFGKEVIEKDPIGQLLKPDFLGEIGFEYEKDPDTVKYLSALYYQLPPEKALDVVFTKEATDALNTGNSERLHEMMGHIELRPILDNAILKVTDVENATLTLAKLDEYYGISTYDEIPKWLKHIWEALYQKCISVGVSWDEICDFHVPLFAHLHKDSLASSIAKGYLSIADEKWNPKVYVETIDKLSENNGIFAKRLKQYERKVSPKLFVELVRLTKEHYNEYGVACDYEELDNYLAGLSLVDLMSSNVIASIGIEPGEVFPKYQTRLKELINDTEPSGYELIEALMIRLKEVSEKPIDFDSFFSDSRIYGIWVEVNDKTVPFKYDLMAMRLARRRHFNSSYSSTFDDAFKIYDDKGVESLAGVIEYYIDYGTLLTQSEYYKSFPILKDVIRVLTVNDLEGSRADVFSCLTHFDQTVTDYDLNAEDLFQNLSGWEIDENEIKISQLPSGLLAVSEKANNSLSKSILGACDKCFRRLSQDEWKNHILKKDDIYRVWQQYHPQKYQTNFDAFKSVMKDYASSVSPRQPDSMLMKEWLNLCLEVKFSVKGLFNEISSILKRDSMINKAKLLFFGGYILEFTDPEKQKDFVQKMIPTEIIDSDVISFIYDHLEQLKACELSDEFKDKVKHLAETTMKGNECIISICRVMDIPVDGFEEGY